MTRMAVVLLTTGDRPTELAAAIASARSQNDVEAEIVLVVNGGEPDVSAAEVVLRPETNLGIPGGRNLGIAAATTDYVAVLDDDAEYLADDVLAGAGRLLDENDDMALVGLGVVDEEGRTERRHQPRLGTEGTSAGAATSFPGCAWVVRRSAFEGVGGLCAEFFYALEETDLSWRLLDRGWSVHYAADLRVFHPRTDPRRHDTYFVHTARNRAWLAHRTLPAVLASAYLFNWTLVTLMRNATDLSAVRAHLNGTLEGLREPVGPREPMRWATALRMARLGRPPVI